MKIENVRLLNKGVGFERWEFILDNVSYIYITNQTYQHYASYTNAVNNFKPYTRVFCNYNDDGIKVSDLAKIQKFLPLDINDPAKGIKKFFSLILLE